MNVSTPTKRYNINPSGTLSAAPGTPPSGGLLGRFQSSGGSRLTEPFTPEAPKKSSALKKGILSSNKVGYSPKKLLSYSSSDPFQHYERGTPSQRYMGTVPKVEPHALQSDSAKKRTASQEILSPEKSKKEKSSKKKRMSHHTRH